MVMEDSEPQRPTLINLPASVRTLIYDACFPFDFTIDICLESKASIGDYTSLLRTCHQLREELTNYLSSKPLTLLCTAGQRPNVLHQIPRHILGKVEVVVIEDSPAGNLPLSMLPSLKCICFSIIWQIPQYTAAVPQAGSTNVDQPIVSTMKALSNVTPASRGPIYPAAALAQLRLASSEASSEASQRLDTTRSPFPLSRSKLFPLVANNEALRLAHEWWKSLRISNTWIREVWKNRPNIRFVLRRVDEVIVQAPGQSQGVEGTIHGYHSVVDVSTKSIIEKKYLPTRSKLDDEGAFEYGAQNWWKLESGWRRSEKVDH